MNARILSRILIVIPMAVALRGQTAVPEVKDPLGRTSPQESIFHFLEACHKRDYAMAIHYLDLRRLRPEERAKEGPELASQLEDLLDDTPFSIATLSRDPQGDQYDGLSADFEHLYTVRIDGQTLDLQMERVALGPGLRVWLVSSKSVEMIPDAHRLVAETPFEKKLPQWLVTFEILDTPVWRWIALSIAVAALWALSGFLTWGLVRTVRAVVDVAAFGGPLRVLLAVAGFRVALEYASPSSLPRLFIDRGLGLILALALAWMAAAAVDVAAERWHAHLDPRVQALRYSVLPLGRQIFKLSVFLIAILGVLSAWGFNTSAILAGLGVGGLAVALAAQKTIENLFGGISVIGDRPVLVGDVCRFGDRTGTVMHIGLRSTRLRTQERTIVSVPNAQFSSMTLENISGRDKIYFHTTLSLRRDTTSEQMLEVLASIGRILAEHPKVEEGKTPVRFIGVGSYSLDVEVSVYIVTSDYDEFLAVQQELLLKTLQAVERTGTALAVPLQETVGSVRPPQA